MTLFEQYSKNACSALEECPTIGFTLAEVIPAILTLAIWFFLIQLNWFKDNENLFVKQLWNNRNCFTVLSRDLQENYWRQWLSKNVHSFFKQQYIWADIFRWVSWFMKMDHGGHFARLTDWSCWLFLSVGVTTDWPFANLNWRPLSAWYSGLITPHPHTSTPAHSSFLPFTACATQPQTLFITTSNSFSFGLHPSHYPALGNEDSVKIQSIIKHCKLYTWNGKNNPVKGLEERQGTYLIPPAAGVHCCSKSLILQV